MKLTTYTKLDRLRIAVSGAFILGILFSKKLWLSDRLYPLTPIFHWFLPFSYPIDIIILMVLCALLIWATISRKPIVIFSTIALTAILFLQDQSRLYPSFYEYVILLLLFGIYLNNTEKEQEERTVMLCQFIVATIYIWSGISKLNPYFISSVLPWLIGPLHLPLYPLFPHFFGFAAALAEIIFGICLFIPRFQKIAFYDLFVMHLCLFFLIGPFRGNNNDSAWAWNMASMIFLYILFSNPNGFSFKRLLQPFSKAAFAVLILIGILPALNLISLWDSALSFNVYSGNTDEAVVTMSQVAYTHVNLEAQRAGYPIDNDDYGVYLDLWNKLEFNAGTYPEQRIFKNIFKELCNETEQDTSLQLIITKKANFLKWQKTEEVFSCSFEKSPT